MSDKWYEAYEARGGYGYVDLRDSEGGATVLGANGGYIPAQAEEIAAALNEAMDPGPAPGKLRLEVTPEEASFIAGLVRASGGRDGLVAEVAAALAAHEETQEPAGPRP